MINRAGGVGGGGLGVRPVLVSSRNQISNLLSYDIILIIDDKTLRLHFGNSVHILIITPSLRGTCFKQQGKRKKTMVQFTVFYANLVQNDSLAK